MRIRSHYVSDTNKIFLPMYKLDRIKEPEELAEWVKLLLEDDRFLCPEENYEVKKLKRFSSLFQRLIKLLGLPTSFFKSGVCGSHDQKILRGY